ncbi:Linamarin synthase 2 [Sesamum angolense]|uniref:Glycosyltransferase n=1 Tax=Sesamum angolense TaxID=2727404 RepID=A0AAE2BQL1_9LAMI|nr:Linamarin synthase 2 [Sesamum angolense]
MGSLKTQKPHVVLVPYPSQGHVTPFMTLAKLLHARGFYVTFVNTEFNHGRLIRSRGRESVAGFPDFRFETIPDGLLPSLEDATQDVPALCDSTRKNCLGPFRELLSRLGATPNVPPVSCVVSDGVMSFSVRAAEEIGVPEVQFWTASVCSFIGYLNFREIVRRGISPFKNENFMKDGSLDKEIDWIPGMRNMRLKDMPSFVRTTDIDDILLNYLGDEAQNCLKASAIIINTFSDLEREVLNAIAPLSPPIYVVGPLTLLSRSISKGQASEFRPTLWREDKSCLEWLDKQEENSVIYVNYGSVTLISEQHLEEFAWGLAHSNHPFLWIVRPDIAMGESAILPQEFFEETKDRCLLTSWCPQEEVLSHPSVAVFLSHCGWNSTLESLSAGVPILCWPFFAEQQTNCRYMCMEWETGVEVDHEVKRDEIAMLVRDVMEGEKGKKMKAKALEWKEKANEATRIGGSSYHDFDRFVEEALTDYALRPRVL